MAALGAPLHEGRKAIRSRDRSRPVRARQAWKPRHMVAPLQGNEPGGRSVERVAGIVLQEAGRHPGSGPTFREDQP